MNICNSREYGLSGTEPVINQERMLVREKVDERQFEWYRDNNEFYYRLKQQLETVFVYLQTKPQYMILITFKTDFFQKHS